MVGVLRLAWVRARIVTQSKPEASYESVNNGTGWGSTKSLKNIGVRATRKGAPDCSHYHP